jgi:ABC-type antimicrobial peptide transport system permease subunit
MKAYRSVRTAMRALRRNLMRAMLTTLGIVIGVAAVIAMMEIGEGTSSDLRKKITSMGANVLMIRPGTTMIAGVSAGAGSEITLTPDDCEAIMRECPAVRSAAPSVRARTQIVYENRNWVPFWMFGTSPEFLDVREWPVEEGDGFTSHDVLNGNRVCLLGRTIADELFEGRSPVGKDIRINNVPFRVVGVLTRKGDNMVGMDQDDVLVAPWTTIKYRVTGAALTNANQSLSSGGSGSSVNTLSNLYPSGQPSLYPQRSELQAANNPMPVRFDNIDQIMAVARSAREIPDAIRQMTSVLRTRHNLRPDEPDDFEIHGMTEMTDTLSSSARVMTNLLLCVAMISLLVGGVGIMNIMLVSVTERTREIGLRMAVGARGRDILRQFLVEAVVLCLVGGALGILLGHGGSILVVKIVLHWPVKTSPTAIALSVMVSAAVGILFGFYPAWKASRLDPIEALRYE